MLLRPSASDGRSTTVTSAEATSGTGFSTPLATCRGGSEWPWSGSGRGAGRSSDVAVFAARATGVSVTGRSARRGRSLRTRTPVRAWARAWASVRVASPPAVSGAVAGVGESAESADARPGTRPDSAAPTPSTAARVPARPTNREADTTHLLRIRRYCCGRFPRTSQHHLIFALSSCTAPHNRPCGRFPATPAIIAGPPRSVLSGVRRRRRDRWCRPGPGRPGRPAPGPGLGSVSARSPRRAAAGRDGGRR